MFSNTYHRLAKYASIKNILIGLVLCVLINTVAFPFGIGKLLEASPNAAGPIDLMFAFTADEVYQTIESYGPEGRDIYFWITLGIDMIYPVIYTLTSMLLLIFLWRKFSPKRFGLNLLSLFPLVTLIADFMENTGTLLMLSSYPQKLATVAQIASIFNALKWISVGFTLLMILVLLLDRLRKLLFSTS